MNKAFFILIFTVIAHFNSFSQDVINNYKYIVVPTEYEFLGEEDKYQLNSLTKFLFNKYGYMAFLENEDLPEDLRKNNCLALYADVQEIKKGLFKTKVQINLLDCGNKLVFSSKIGETKVKEFKKAFNLALRGAFETFQYYSYSYKPNEKITSDASKPSPAENVLQANKEIERLQKEVIALKEGNSQNIKVAVVPPVKNNVESKTTVINEATITLYAQLIENGFQLVDSTPKVVMILLKTSKTDLFIVKDNNAIVYKEDGFWYYSKNDGKNVSIKTLDIKF